MCGSPCTRVRSRSRDDLKAQRVDESSRSTGRWKPTSCGHSGNPDGSLKGSVDLRDTPTSFGEGARREPSRPSSRGASMRFGGACPSAPAGGRAQGEALAGACEPVRDYHVVGRGGSSTVCGASCGTASTPAWLFLPGVGEDHGRAGNAGASATRSRAFLTASCGPISAGNIVDSAELRAWGEALGNPSRAHEQFSTTRSFGCVRCRTPRRPLHASWCSTTWRIEMQGRFMELGPRCVFPVHHALEETVAKELGAGGSVPS